MAEPLKLPGWLSWLGPIILAVAAYLRGREDEQQRQQTETDKLQDHYDEIADSPLDVDDAFDRLQRRADAAARLGNGKAGGKGVP